MARKGGQLIAIKKITRHGAADGCHMHTDLVGAAGFQPKAQKAEARAGFQGFIMGHGGRAMLIHHALERFGQV